VEDMLFQYFSNNNKRLSDIVQENKKSLSKQGVCNISYDDIILIAEQIVKQAPESFE